jgi:hypothetical protein
MSYKKVGYRSRTGPTFFDLTKIFGPLILRGTFPEKKAGKEKKYSSKCESNFRA